jgi:uncharacterized membrane protein YuzA (DUF378 family)
MVAGALNWLLVGLFNFDLVAAIFGGTSVAPSVITRIVYVLVGLAGIYGIAMLAKLASDREDICVPGHEARFAGQVR